MAAITTGIYHRSYRSELALRHTKAEYFRLALVVLAVLAVPFTVNVYWLGVLNTILIAVIGAVGLNILVGFTGQISLGQGAFLAIGAYTSAIVSQRAGLPVPVAILLAVVLTAAVGAVFGLPAVRLKGLYLAIVTLAAQVIVVVIARRWTWLTDGVGFITLDRVELLPGGMSSGLFELQWFVILVILTALAVLTARNLFRSGYGRAFMAVRDQDIAAAAIGVDVTRTKLTAFAVSSGYVGLAGALTAHYTGTITWERFTLDVSILYLAMIIVGGLGSVAGAVYGAAFMMLIPIFLDEITALLGNVVGAGQLPALQNAVFGLVIILFLIFEPRGLDRIWQRAKDYVRFWPFRY